MPLPPPNQLLYKIIIKNKKLAPEIEKELLTLGIFVLRLRYFSHIYEDLFVYQIALPVPIKFLKGICLF